MRLSRHGGFLTFLILFLAAGCGLSDYEKRMDEQSVSLKRFDEENNALGEPLELPIIVDKKGSWNALAVDFYLRPQKGTKPLAAGGPFKPQEFALFRYPGPAGFNVLVTTSKLVKDVKDEKVKDEKVKDEKVKDEKVKNPKAKKVGMTTKEFQRAVRQALADFYFNEYKKTIDWSKKDKTEKTPILVYPVKGPPVNVVFENQILTDDPDPGKKKPTTDGPDKSKNEYHDFRLFFYQTANDQAAVIYQIPAAKRADNDVNNGVVYSIRTLALGLESLNRRVEFRKRKR